MNEIKQGESDIDPEKLVFAKPDGKIFNFNTFKSSFKFAPNIYHRKITLEEAKKDQYKMLKQLKILEKCNPNNPDKINSRQETIINVVELHNNRDNVIRHLRHFRLRVDFEKRVRCV